MKVIENNTETTKLTNKDLAIAAYSLAELHNAYLASYEDADYEGTMTKEEMQETIESIRVAHVKFDALVQTTEASFQQQQAEVTDDTEE
tara:strand:- start:504 stop:770 length:267 start_codon:yes stop_codon:yes gene_type:complete